MAQYLMIMIIIIMKESMMTKFYITNGTLACVRVCIIISDHLFDHLCLPKVCNLNDDCY